MNNEPFSNLRQGLILLFLFVNICLLMFIFSPPGHLNPAKGLETQTIAPVKSFAPKMDVILYWKLVGNFNDGDWRVEKYREYEQHLDQNGNVTDDIPTAHYDFVRYWRYN